MSSDDLYCINENNNIIIDIFCFYIIILVLEKNVPFSFLDLIVLTVHLIVRKNNFIYLLYKWVRGYRIWSNRHNFNSRSVHVEVIVSCIIVRIDGVIRTGGVISVSRGRGNVAPSLTTDVRRSSDALYLLLYSRHVDLKSINRRIDFKRSYNRCESIQESRTPSIALHHWYQTLIHLESGKIWIFEYRFLCLCYGGKDWL